MIRVAKPPPWPKGVWFDYPLGPNPKKKKKIEGLALGGGVASHPYAVVWPPHHVFFIFFFRFKF